MEKLPCVWFMLTAPPGSAQLLSLIRFSMGKGVAPLSPGNERGSLGCILSNPYHLCIACAESGAIDWWSWQILIILEALLDSKYNALLLEIGQIRCT